MAVCIRLSRFGRLHRPFFRIVAIDRRNAREGLSNEVIGTYDPALEDGKAIVVKADRVEAWMAQGAILSDALRNLFKHHGIAVKLPVSAKIQAKIAEKASDKVAKKGAPKKDGKKFVAASRRAVKKHEAKLKAVRKLKTDADVAAAAAAKAAAAAAPAADAPTA
jgi:small subunit ribosomal protein S16